MKIIAQVYVYRCDHDGCQAGYCGDWEPLPPGWQEITVGAAQNEHLQANHFCPEHHYDWRDES